MFQRSFPKRTKKIFCYLSIVCKSKWVTKLLQKQMADVHFSSNMSGKLWAPILRHIVITSSVLWIRLRTFPFVPESYVHDRFWCAQNISLAHLSFPPKKLLQFAHSSKKVFSAKVTIVIRDILSLRLNIQLLWENLREFSHAAVAAKSRTRRGRQEIQQNLERLELYQ